MRVAPERWTQVPEGMKGAPPLNAKNGAQKYCTFVPTPEPPVNPKSDRLVITIGVGKMKEILRLAEPHMRDYAARIGADFIAITNGTQSWPMAEKFRLGYYARKYKRTLFLDADIFVRPHSPSIFDVVPEGAVGTHDDLYYLDSGQGKFRDTSWIEAEVKMLGLSQDVTMQRACLNSGVTVVDRNDADIWNAPREKFPVAHAMEQHWVQHAILATGHVYRLPQEWNYQWWMEPDFRGIDSAHFIHLAGLSHFHPDLVLPMMRALCVR